MQENAILHHAHLRHHLLSTLNSQLSTLNSQLSTLNSQLSTLNSQLSTLNSDIDNLYRPLPILNLSNVFSRSRR
jgi:chaperonin cofactor prefoldin